jgi:hypothetical protein
MISGNITPLARWGVPVPGDDKWYGQTFHVTDANFADTWGWNFRIDVAGSPADVWVKEVKVKRNAPKK